MINEVVAKARDRNARICRGAARAHDPDSYWGRRFTKEAEGWEAAAARARAGDLTPFIPGNET